MTVPEEWEPAKPEAYENLPRGVHAMYASQQDESKTRALLQVAVIERTLFVTKEGREEFRAAAVSEIKGSDAAKAGVQIEIESVEVDRVGDRDVYRMNGFQITKEMAPVKIVKWYVPAGDKQYVFSFSSSAKTYPYRVAEFEQIVRSIRMREPAPAKPGPGTDWSFIVTVAGIAVAVICGIAFVIVLKAQLRRAPEAGK